MYIFQKKNSSKNLKKNRCRSFGKNKPLIGNLIHGAFCLAYDFIRRLSCMISIQLLLKSQGKVLQSSFIGKETKAEMLDMRALRANERKYDEHPMVKISRIKAF